MNKKGPSVTKSAWDRARKDIVQFTLSTTASTVGFGGGFIVLGVPHQKRLALLCGFMGVCNVIVASHFWFEMKDKLKRPQIKICADNPSPQ